MGHTIVNNHFVTYSALQKYDALTAILFVLHCIFFYYRAVILFIAYYEKCAECYSHDCAVKDRIGLRVNIHPSTILLGNK